MAFYGFICSLSQGSQILNHILATRSDFLATSCQNVVRIVTLFGKKYSNILVPHWHWLLNAMTISVKVSISSSGAAFVRHTISAWLPYFAVFVWLLPFFISELLFALFIDTSSGFMSACGINWSNILSASSSILGIVLDNPTHIWFWFHDLQYLRESGLFFVFFFILALPKL